MLKQKENKGRPTWTGEVSILLEGLNTGQRSSRSRKKTGRVEKDRSARTWGKTPCIGEQKKREGVTLNRRLFRRRRNSK